VLARVINLEALNYIVQHPFSDFTYKDFAICQEICLLFFYPLRNMVKYDATIHGDVDIIFAGGGTAACVTAGRLAKANPSLKILLIEMGPESFEDPTIRSPALFRSHMTPDSKTAIVSSLTFQLNPTAIHCIRQRLLSSSSPNHPRLSKVVKRL
jgi:hypothetical protein